MQFFLIGSSGPTIGDPKKSHMGMRDAPFLQGMDQQHFHAIALVTMLALYHHKASLSKCDLHIQGPNVCCYVCLQTIHA